MGAARMKDQEDFDLERFIDMFDQALTSNDERVVNALRSLMMMVILTNPEDGGKRAAGPLKRMMDDHNNIFRRLEQMEHQIRTIQQDQKYGENKYRDVADQLRGKEQYYKWPAQHAMWDVHHDVKAAIQKINSEAITANKIQPQPLTKKEK